MRPDCGYGLFCFDTRFLEPLTVLSRLEWPSRLPSAEEEPVLKLASFFTHVENGRLRPVRSWRSNKDIISTGWFFSQDDCVQAGSERRIEWLKKRKAYLPAGKGDVSVMAICLPV